MGHMRYPFLMRTNVITDRVIDYRPSYVPKSKEIVLQYSTNEDLMSKLIRWRSGSLWSHVDVVTLDNSLIGSRYFAVKAKRDSFGLMQSYPSGVQKRCTDYMEFSHALRIKLTHDRASDFYAWLDAQIGKPYDLTAIWGFTFNRDWHDEDAWFCDELVLAGLENIGFFPNKLSLPLWRIDPGASQLVLSATPTYTEVEGY